MITIVCDSLNYVHLKNKNETDAHDVCRDLYQFIPAGLL
jgi:hypothetical protein